MEVSLDVDDIQATKSFKDMLSFYGLELQSHAGVLVGLILLVFAIVQAWASLSPEVRASPAHGFAFSAFAGLIGTGIVYVLLRLYVYGQLASALMYVGFQGIYDAKKKYLRDSPGYWELLPAITKVNVYTQFIFQRNSKRLIRARIFDPLLHVRIEILATAFVVWFLASYGLIFGDGTLRTILEYAAWYVVLVPNILAFRWDVKLILQRLKKHEA